MPEVRADGTTEVKFPWNFREISTKFLDDLFWNDFAIVSILWSFIMLTLHYFWMKYSEISAKFRVDRICQNFVKIYKFMKIEINMCRISIFHKPELS